MCQVGPVELSALVELVSIVEFVGGDEVALGWISMDGFRPNA